MQACAFSSEEIRTCQDSDICYLQQQLPEALNKNRTHGINNISYSVQHQKILTAKAKNTVFPKSIELIVETKKPFWTVSNGVH